MTGSGLAVDEGLDHRPAGHTGHASGGAVVRVLRTHWPTLVAMAVALATRLPRLGYPRVLVFDEVFYAPDAADTLQWGAEHGRAVHPPLGKLLISAGIKLFGFTPFGWRFSALVAGVAVVGLSAAVVRRLTGKGWPALAAGLLVGLDGVMFTSGRLAMLDVFVALFVMLTVWALTVAWTADPSDRRGVRRAGVAAISFAGLGGSVKWSTLWLLPVVACVLWVLDWRTVERGRRRRRAVGATALLLLLLPPGLYLLTWAPREAGPVRMTPAQFVDQQRAVARFHLELRPSNSNAAPATTWLWLGHPTGLYIETCLSDTPHEPVGVCPAHAGDVSEVRILSLPNPAVWVAGLLGAVGLAVVAVRRRVGAAIWLLAAAATQWVPWLLNPRAAYSFYLASLVPLLVVGAAVVVGRGRRRVWPVVTAVASAAAVGLFVFFYPVWTAEPLSIGAFDLRMWLKGWGL